MSTKYKRRKKLIKPRFQLKLAFAGLCIAFISVMVLLIMLNNAIMEMMNNGWLDPVAVQSGWLSMLATRVLLAAVVLIPLTMAVGILFTHRIAGPMYRFELFLRAVAKGEQRHPCKIRDKDEFQEFCDLLNEVTEPLREQVPEASEDAPPAAEAAEAAEDAVAA